MLSYSFIFDILKFIFDKTKINRRRKKNPTHYSQLTLTRLIRPPLHSTPSLLLIFFLCRFPPQDVFYFFNLNSNTHTLTLINKKFVRLLQKKEIRNTSWKQKT